jgi:6-phosphogluconolactonase/glucosamine-6-phosphate isomerase/deaminase
MEYVRTDSPDAGAIALAESLAASLGRGMETLWLICGGSNIKTAAHVLDLLIQKEPKTVLNLRVLQTDERYGAVGHPDSNWQQMIEAGFQFNQVRAFPILVDAPLEETARRYSVVAEEMFRRAKHIVAQFGMGTDGHIAGILPHSMAVQATTPVVGYVAEPFTRITLSPPMLRQIHEAYVFVFGEPKKEALLKLRDSSLSLEDQPAQILKEIPRAILYNDQL